MTDAYEEGHRRLAIKLAVPGAGGSWGPAADRGELQLYLASIVFCPSILLNHKTLQWSTLGGAADRASSGFAGRHRR